MVTVQLKCSCGSTDLQLVDSEVDRMDNCNFMDFWECIDCHRVWQWDFDTSRTDSTYAYSFKCVHEDGREEVSIG